jgi:hypothetical protein
MILWKDFILDDRFGPLLFGADEASAGDVAAVMEECDGQNIQETRQGRQPARMVGNNLLESQRGQACRDAGATASAQILSALAETGAQS